MASTIEKTAPAPVSLTIHQGLDYAVLMRPGETTGTAFVQIRYPDDDDMALLTVLGTAPDMLALLKELIDIEGSQPGTASWAAKVTALIAKAEGR